LRLQGCGSAGTESGYKDRQGCGCAPSDDPEFFRLLFEFAPDAILVVDAQGRIVQANAQAEKLFGYDRNALINEPIELLGLVTGAEHDTTARRPDGTEFRADLAVSTVETSRGSLVMYVVRDLSGRKEARAAAQLASIVDPAEDAIVSRDIDGIILSWNPAAERMFGWLASEVVGRHFSYLGDDRAGHDPLVFSRIARGGQIEQYESTRRLKDGSFVEVLVTLSPMTDAHGNVVGYTRIFRDLSDRKSAREKETLLQEIHHRVKNNLSVISSLFFLQSTYAHDEGTVRILKESQDRVRSIALVHEALYRSRDLGTVNLADYAKSLARQLLQTYRQPGRCIRLSTELEPVDIGIDQAVPCGLILNELITNSLKHGFQEKQTGEIRITLKAQEGGMHLLEVADDGAEFSGDTDARASSSMGLRLVRSLTQQLDGSFELVPTAGGARSRLKLALAISRRERDFDGGDRHANAR
jgi:PAS domain S-box-containing protein